jgi:very-short-patch-repair endonuclease
MFVQGLPCTNILRTLVDLGAVDADAVHGAVGHAITTKLADLRAIQTTVVEHSRQGRSGVVALRTAVADWAIDAKPADSVLEIAMSHLIRRYRLPPVTFHPVIEGYELDFVVDGTPVLLECDGWASHGLNKTQFERDRARDAELTAKGWIVVHFTYRQITMEPKATADRFREAIERWSSIGTPSSPDAA